MNKPIIGITTDDYLPERAPKYSENFILRKNYCSAVEKAGGVPIIIPYSINLVNNYSNFLDAIVISGGNFDVDPSHFGEEINSHVIQTKPSRTDFEINIIKEMLGDNKPVLGICGGQQLLHVILGGKLIQHIPDEINTEINHEQPNPRNQPGHKVEIRKASLLYDIIGKSILDVNSAHHQAVKDKPDGVTLNAFAPDGVIEGIESKNYNFCLGVQWHPEFLVNDYDIKIFRALIDASKKNK